VLLTDLMMPNVGGLELMREARKLDAYMEMIVITAAGSLETAIGAMRDGHAWGDPVEIVQPDAADADLMADIGWNAVRLLLSWSRVEPAPGETAPVRRSTSTAIRHADAPKVWPLPKTLPSRPPPCSTVCSHGVT